MKEFLLSISSIILIFSILNLILPHGKISKSISSVFGILLLLVIIKPIINLKESGSILYNFTENNEIVIDEEYLYYVTHSRVNQIKNNVNNILNENGIEKSVITIDYDVDEDFSIKINKIYVDLRNSVIISNKEHIDVIESVLKEITSKINIEKNMVEIYE